MVDSEGHSATRSGAGDTATPRGVLVDLDGTLALHSGHRNPYDWRRAHRDVPNAAVVAVVRALHRDGIAVVYMTGRPEAARDITERWIERHVGVAGPLFLRADGDQRQDAIVKRELFDAHVADRYVVIAVLDDRQQVVDMWRNELGLACFQVAPGDF